MTVYKIGYWTGDDEGTNLDLIAEMVTTDPRFAAESIHALAYGIEEGDPRVQQIEELNLKVATLDKMLREAERELSDREETLTELAPARKLREAAEDSGCECHPNEAADIPVPADSLTTPELWEVAKSKIQKAVDLTARNIAHAAAAQAGRAIKEQEALAANLQKTVG